MKEKMIPLVTMLTAGAVTCLVCILKKYETLYSLKLLLAVLIVFYVIGRIAKKLLDRVTAQPAAEDEDEEGDGQEEDAEEEEQEETPVR